MRNAIKGKRTGRKFIYENGAVRFQGNRIIRDMMKAIEYRGLNEAVIGVRNGQYTMAELRQYYRLTEMSTSGYRDVFPANKGARLACEDAAEIYEMLKPKQEKTQ